MRTLHQALLFWGKTFYIAGKRSRPTLKRLPYYVITALVAYFWRHEAQSQVLFALLTAPVVWAITMLAQLFFVPAELCSLSIRQRNLQDISLRLRGLYDKGNQLAVLPGDINDDVAVEHLRLIEQWRKEARAAVAEYAQSESILFDTIADDHIRNAHRYDRPKAKRDSHLAAVLLEMNKLRLIASRASQEAEETEKKIHTNRIEVIAK